jgi:hypothetical protein
MTPNFHIFKSEFRGRVRWLGSRDCLGAAKQFVRTAGQCEPGDYLIFNINTGNRFTMTVTSDESAEAASHSQRG